MSSAALVVDTLTRWRSLLDYIPLRGPSPAHKQLVRELDEAIRDAEHLRTREELGGDKEGA